VKKKVITLIGIVVGVFLLVYIGVSLTSNSGDGGPADGLEAADKRLEKMMKKIKVTTADPIKGQVDINPVSIADTLPEIDKFAISVENSTNNFVEIFSSTEKSGTGVDGWLNEVAEQFNKQGIQVNGKPASVKIRNIASGTAADFIRSGKYVPDAFTPSNELWGEMVKAAGVKTTLITDRLVGNVTGIVTTKTKHDQLIEQYGEINVNTITEAIADNALSMGYTDPFASSTGLNFLVTALQGFDANDLLSAKAVAGFERFQANVPFIASTTLQMREAAKTGMLDAFVLEYQTFVNATDFKAGYEFTPFGARHDSPLYGLGDLSKEKQDILKAFADFVKQETYQELAKKNGFNGLEEYQSQLNGIDGATLTAAQRVWKEKKNVSKPVAAVFVADVSGSMDGDPLSRLKESLLTGQKYLGRDNSIGLVSYSTSVEINLPLGVYDMNQQSMFVGAVESLQAGGGTATFDAITVAINMLQEQLAVNANIRPIIFVLSDGQTNEGHKLKDIKGLIEAYKIPIYTIGYNADLEELQEISKINEAASINADTDDVVYKIGSLLNVQL